MDCPLCFSESREFSVHESRKFFECTNCKGIFLNEEHYCDPVSEKKRYETHHNDVNDPRYQKFVSPVVKSVIENFDPEDHVGLDFGAGTGPVITKLLTERQFEVFAYDPFFLPFPELLQNTYDFIICCEVIEHFKKPALEFEMLRGILRPRGKLLCMTHLFPPEVEFGSWYYKNDPTHVFIYREETLHYICKKFNFLEVKISGRLITFSI